MSYGYGRRDDRSDWYQGYRTEGSGNDGKEKEKKKKPSPVSAEMLLFGIVVLVTLAVGYVQADEQSRRMIGWIGRHLPEILIALVVNGGLVYWLSVTDSKEMAEIAGALLRVAVGLTVMWFMITAALEFFVAAADRAINGLGPFNP